MVLLTWREWSRCSRRWFDGRLASTSSDYVHVADAVNVHDYVYVYVYVHDYVYLHASLRLYPLEEVMRCVLARTAQRRSDARLGCPIRVAGTYGNSLPSHSFGGFSQPIGAARGNHYSTRALGLRTALLFAALATASTGGRASSIAFAGKARVKRGSGVRPAPRPNRVDVRKAGTSGRVVLSDGRTFGARNLLNPKQSIAIFDVPKRLVRTTWSRARPLSDDSYDAIGAWLDGQLTGILREAEGALLAQNKRLSLERDPTRHRWPTAFATRTGWHRDGSALRAHLSSGGVHGTWFLLRHGIVIKPLVGQIVVVPDHWLWKHVTGAAPPMHTGPVQDVEGGDDGDRDMSLWRWPAPRYPL